MKKGLFAAALFSLLFISTQAAFSEYGQSLANGTFDENLSYWTIEPKGTHGVVWYDQAAVLLNPGDLPLDPSWPFYTLTYDENNDRIEGSFYFLTVFSTDSTYPTDPIGDNLDYSLISQPLTLPVNADMISFDVIMEIYNRFRAPFETDIFTVVVYGPDMPEQQIFYLDTDDVQNPIGDINYEYNDWDYGIEFWTQHLGYHTTSSYKIPSEWAGQDVTIEFRLDHDFDDNVQTTVTVDDVAISVKGDATPPAVTVGELMELWPPNHKYRTFNLSDCVLSAGDDTDGQLNIDEVGTILSIYSDEPEESTAKGDGNFLDDIVILGPSSFKVRAERQGAGNGRTYGVTFEVKDSSGNSTIATFYLGVPHDQSGNPIVDDGPESGYIVNAF